MIFVGIDWSEAHHDVCVMNTEGRVLAKGRVPEGVEGLARLHEMVAANAEEPSEVAIGIELDRGLLVGALVASGYAVHAVNPLSVDRYRDRHRTSGAKSDPGDAKVLADLVRTDRHLHRQVAGDSELAEALKVLARGHQGLVWSRQRHLNQLRNALREFYPAALEAFGTDLASTDALAVLIAAPTPAAGRSLSAARIAAALKRGGRRRRVTERAGEIREALRSSQLEAPEMPARAYGEVVRSTVAIVAEMTGQIQVLARELEGRFEEHPDAEILRSLPGLGVILGARVLAEFGDDPTRYADPKARKNYAGTSPITKASGRSKVALARFAGIDGWPTRWRCGRSARSAPRPAPGATTTPIEPGATPIDGRFDRWLIGGWGSSTAACDTAGSTRSRSRGPRSSRPPLDSYRPWDV